MTGRIHLRHGRGRRKPGEMNRNEQAYAAYLELRRHAGEVLEYHYEAVKFRLADKTWFTADFMVMMPDGMIVFVDCKGFKAKPSGEPGYWAEDDSRVKIKCVAEKYPFIFRIAYQDKSKVWHEEEI